MKLSDKQQQALVKLKEAEWQFLFEFGWIKVSEFHVTPMKRIEYIFLGDNVLYSVVP